MKLFLSHSSRDKALIREIKNLLPSFIRIWLDEIDLTIGGDLERSLNEAIQNDVDYFLVFLGHEALQSKWVKKEISWAMKREKELGRVFIIPILLDDIWKNIKPVSFKRRLYISCLDQSKHGVKSFAENLSSNLFKVACERLNNIKKEKLEENLKILYTSRREMPASKHYFDLLNKVETSLTICGVSLNFAIGQSLTALFDLIKNNPKIKVNLLLFNPKSRNLGFVAKFANKTVKSLRHEINANIETVSNRIKNELSVASSSQLELKFYDAPPVFSMTLINREIKNKGLMLIEFFQYKGDTDDRISMEVKSHSPIYKKYLHSFDKLWNEATEIPS